MAAPKANSIMSGTMGMAILNKFNYNLSWPEVHAGMMYGLS